MVLQPLIATAPGTVPEERGGADGGWTDGTVDVTPNDPWCWALSSCAVSLFVVPGALESSLSSCPVRDTSLREEHPALDDAGILRNHVPHANGLPGGEPRLASVSPFSLRFQVPRSFAWRQGMKPRNLQKSRAHQWLAVPLRGRLTIVSRGLRVWI